MLWVLVRKNQPDLMITWEFLPTKRWRKSRTWTGRNPLPFPTKNNLKLWQPNWSNSNNTHKRMMKRTTSPETIPPNRWKSQPTSLPNPDRLNLKFIPPVNPSTTLQLLSRSSSTLIAMMNCRLTTKRKKTRLKRVPISRKTTTAGRTDGIRTHRRKNL